MEAITSVLIISGTSKVKFQETKQKILERGGDTEVSLGRHLNFLFAISTHPQLGQGFTSDHLNGVELHSWWKSGLWPLDERLTWGESSFREAGEQVIKETGLAQEQTQQQGTQTRL